MDAAQNLENLISTTGSLSAILRRRDASIGQGSDPYADSVSSLENSSREIAESIADTFNSKQSFIRRREVNSPLSQDANSLTEDIVIDAAGIKEGYASGLFRFLDNLIQEVNDSSKLTKSFPYGSQDPDENQRMKVDGLRSTAKQAFNIVNSIITTAQEQLEEFQYGDFRASLRELISGRGYKNSDQIIANLDLLRDSTRDHLNVPYFRDPKELFDKMAQYKEPPQLRALSKDLKSDTETREFETGLDKQFNYRVTFEGMSEADTRKVKIKMIPVNKITWEEIPERESIVNFDDLEQGRPMMFTMFLNSRLSQLLPAAHRSVVNVLNSVMSL